MADSAVPITAGTGTNIDTRTESTNGNHRQVIVLGDPSDNSGLLGVNASLGVPTYLSVLATIPVVGRVTVDAGTNVNTSPLALEAGGNLESIASALNVTLGSRQASGATLPITGSVGQSGTWTVQPGNTPNTTAWLVTMGTLPVVTSLTGSLPVAGGSLTSYQGGVWSVLASIPVPQSLTAAGGSLTAYQGSAPWSVLATVSNVLTIQSLPTLSVLQGTTPWSTSNAGGSLTAYQGSAPWSVLATISNNVNALNAGGSLTAFQGSAPWSVLATISNSLTVQSLPTLSVYQGGPWTVTNTEVRSSSATVSSVASSATSVSVVASNTSRRAITFYNDCDKSCYLKFGTTASTSSFTIRIFPNGFFSMPFPAYTGAIDGIWEAAPTGSLRVTEY